MPINVKDMETMEHMVKDIPQFFVQTARNGHGMAEIIEIVPQIKPLAIIHNFINLQKISENRTGVPTAKTSQ